LTLNTYKSSIAQMFDTSRPIQQLEDTIRE
jgi:hypothetical protein